MTDEKTTGSELTQEQLDMFVDGGIYTADQHDFDDVMEPWRGTSYARGDSHCIDWTFVCSKQDDGTIRMCDTFWSDTFSDDGTTFVIDAANFRRMAPRFKLAIARMSEWHRASDAELYSDADVVRIVMHQHERKSFVRNGAHKPLANRLHKLMGKLRDDAHDAGSTNAIRHDIDDIRALLAQADEYGITIDDFDEQSAIAEELVSSHDKVRLGDVADGDMGGYLSHRCYCPNEVYDEAGFCYMLISPDTDAYLLGSRSEESDGTTFDVSFYALPSEHQIVSVWVGSDGRVASNGVTRYDLTRHNVSELSDPYEKDGIRCDTFGVRHDNVGASEYVDKVEAALPLLEQYHKAITM